MKIPAAIAAAHSEIVQWRRYLHAHPELSFEERRTGDFVAEKLLEWGIEVHRGLAGTGVVGTLRGREPVGRSIGLRADMDALPVTELNTFEHASTLPGKMHACGHDGHTAMLLGAARHLAQNRNFQGTVHFIFQPAEEGLGGAERMIKEGLFSRFPVDAVYGLHNWPGLPLGKVGIRTGAMMAAADVVEIDVIGVGGHGAMPHLAIDPVLTAAHIIIALQSLISRSTDPLQAAVLSITVIETGTADNVIPGGVRMRGTTRTLSPSVRDKIESGISRVARNVAAALGAEATVRYQRNYPVLVNSAREVANAVHAATLVVGSANVDADIEPIMGSEDFACMLESNPGAYIFLGQAGNPNSCMVHSPHYDFNDDLLPIGISYWVSLVENQLALGAGSIQVIP